MAQSIDFTHADVANRALAEVRARPIKSFDDEDERTQAVVAGYYTMVDHLLTVRKWHFNRLWSKLTAADAALDKRGWTHSHALPEDRIGPPIQLVADPQHTQAVRFFQLTESAVLSEHPDLWCEAPRRSQPANWPGYFRTLAVTALAARYALTIRNDETTANGKLTEAFGTPSLNGNGGLLKLAGDADFAARPPEELLAGEAFTGNRFRDTDDGCRYMKF